MPALKHDRQNLSELIAAHESYLRQVQLQHARLGANAPPHIATEIERVEAELAQLRSAAATPVSDDLVEQLGPVGRYQLWMSHIMRLDANIGRVEKKVDELRDLVVKYLAELAVAERRAARRRKAP